MLISLAVLALATFTSDTTGRSRVWIEGSSNVHSWSCRATSFAARLEHDQVTVRVPVRDLKCGNKRMERDLYAALKATDEANPSFIIARFAAPPVTADTSRQTQGTLSVAGVEREVRVTLATERAADGTVWARGSLPLLMTDYGVKPPVGLLGLIRSRNEVMVRFELIVSAPES